MKTFIVIWTLVHLDTGHVEKGLYGDRYRTLAECKKANEVNYYEFELEDIGHLVLRLDCVEIKHARKIK